MDIQIKCCCDLQSVSTEKKDIETDQQILSMLSTVLERCKKEKDNNCLQVPLEDYLERVSYYTAYPKMFIYYMIEDNDFQEETLDIYDHILLMECINFMYSQKRLPKFNNFFEEFIEFKSNRLENYKVTSIPDIKTFKKKLYAWDYLYGKVSDGSVMLMENPKIKFERFNYLNKIRNHRLKGRQIYYVDERHIFKNVIKKYRCILEEKPTSRPFNGFLYFHIITCNGYENGLYTCHEPERSIPETFKKWMIEVVLHTIKPSSVIVMEHSVLHGLLPKKSITRYHTKKEMVQWLRENNIPCDSIMQKPQLFELIEKCTLNNRDYDIDRVFKSCGHDVLRLPKTFASLTPTTFFWNYVEKNFKITEGNTTVAVKNMLTQFINNLDTLAWATFVDEVVRMENDIFEIDAIAENLIEEY